MKKNSLFVFFLTLVVVVSMTGSAKAGGAHLEVTFVQSSLNHVDFTVTWNTDEPDATAAWPFDFGDGSPKYVLVGKSGTATFPHDYAYSVGGTVTYHPSIDLDDWTNPWEGTVTIDDRQVVYTIYLPLVIKSPAQPSCSIGVTSQIGNHVEFDVTWENAGAGAHTVLFGDETQTKQFSGPSGTGTTWHDYSWNQGNFTATVNLDGGGSCSVQGMVHTP